ncbi:hypothetical protein E2C01_020943 [Portunus trituberculatus]|uniref:Uncharacterized protein n=1 Tax=Portunus trituberculatus TaxID=210409 RepID=A0A5B7E3E0_PORTR|nr:hypothetical protein [Portunus trituberculatus]
MPSLSYTTPPPPSPSLILPPTSPCPALHAIPVFSALTQIARQLSTVSSTPTDILGYRRRPAQFGLWSHTRRPGH